MSSERQGRKEAHLFVYGTLRRAFSHPMQKLLERGGMWRGEGTCQGRLYDLGAYPGMVDPDAPEDEVTGDVYALAPARQDKVLHRLDRYEGVEAGLYRREQRSVVLGGEEVNAWVYLYDRPLEDAELIPSGDYAAHAEGT